jgi:hypothetical protein
MAGASYPLRLCDQGVTGGWPAPIISGPDDGVATFTRPREAVGREMESSGPGGAIPILPKHSLQGATTRCMCGGAI